MKKKAAFTLSELLLALIIVGVIAVITIPVLVNNYQKKYYANKVKNFVAQIERIAQQELLRHHTRDLSNTNFNDPEKLFSDKHFAILKSCSASTSQNNCWKNNKYKRIDNAPVNIFPAFTVILKNGIIVKCGNNENSYYDTSYGAYIFFIDINGNDKPNVAGRDYFNFFVTKNGRVVDANTLERNKYTLAQIFKKCTSQSSPTKWCYSALVNNNWKIDY